MRMVIDIAVDYTTDSEVEAAEFKAAIIQFAKIKSSQMDEAKVAKIAIMYPEMVESPDGGDPE